MLNLHWGSATDTGRHRQANEDSLYCSPSVCAVADGIGGSAAGEVASRLAVESLFPLGDSGAPVSVDALAAAIAAANQAILRVGAQRPECAGLGTTLTGVAVAEVAGVPHWAVFNIGDSRVYRFADSRLSQLSVDHSAVQELMTVGLLDAAGARSHPQRNVVTRSLGSQAAVHPDIELYEVLAGDRFLICSDGLTNELLDAEIAQILAAYPAPEQSAGELVRRANQAGGRDNITVVVLDLLPD